MDNGNVYVITSDFGNDMTHCTIGAMIVTDIVMGLHNPWASMYSPARKVIHGISDFINEQANTLAQYADWLKGVEVASSIEDIPAGRSHGSGWGTQASGISG